MHHPMHAAAPPAMRMHTHALHPLPEHQPQVTEKLEPLAEKLEVPEKVKVNA